MKYLRWALIVLTLLFLILLCFGVYELPEEQIQKPKVKYNIKYLV